MKITQLIIFSLGLCVTTRGTDIMFEKVQAIILAAGKSTRFKTGTTKLIAPICGQEMILYTTKLLSRLQIPTTIVVGYQKELIMDTVQKVHQGTVQFVTQQEQRGTGHALICTTHQWSKDHILIINGDMPLITREIIQDLYTAHKEADADISFVTAHLDDINHSYGRVIQNGDKVEIVEAKNFTDDPHAYCVINAGIYIAKRSFLQEGIAQLAENEQAKEFYITDLVKIACDQGKKVATTSAPFDMVRGINTLQELWAAEQIKRSEIIKELMDKGVRFSVAQNVHIDLDVEIGAGSYIGCGAHIIKGTKIGKNCVIHESVSIEGSVIGDESVVLPFCVITDSSIGSNTSVGPFAHIRNHADIGNNCTIGNFVEVKQSTLGNKTKAKHLSYLGNATIGSNVNIGAGTITCNHNGVTKNETIIEDGAYIGSNNTLVAPLTVGKDSFTAAGSVITANVPEAALAIGRSRQVNKEGYAIKLRNNEQILTTTELQEEELRFSGAVKNNTDSPSTDNL